MNVSIEYQHGLEHQVIKVEIDTMESEEQKIKKSFAGQIQTYPIKLSA